MIAECGAVGRGLAIRRDGELSAFALLAESANGLRLGPAAAIDTEAAFRLLRAALARADGRPVEVGVLAESRPAVQVLTALGFTPQAPCLRIRLGPPAALPDPVTYVAIAGGAVG